MYISQAVSQRPAGTHDLLMSDVARNPGRPSDLILIIDDSLTIRAIAETSLSRAGYTCLSFADGASALRWLRQAAPCVPRLLLLDLGLPDIDGYQIARLLRANPFWNEMAIVMLTGHNSAIDRIKGRLAGACLYLTKPFRVEQLVAVVHSIVSGTQPAVEETGKERGEQYPWHADRNDVPQANGWPAHGSQFPAALPTTRFAHTWETRVRPALRRPTWRRS
jgi:DNA-binding response OmpR family regulator